jgi:hypothetical protein
VHGDGENDEKCVDAGAARDSLSSRLFGGTPEAGSGAFHELRFEQAEQNAAIEAAERRRREQVKTAGTVAANAVPAS